MGSSPILGILYMKGLEATECRPKGGKGWEAVSEGAGSEDEGV